MTLDVLSWAVLLRADSYIRDSRGDYFGRFISCFAASIGERRSPGALSKIEYLEGDSATKVKEYDGVVRSLWEVNQLYEQFRWNYGELRRLVPCDRFDFLPDGFTSGGFGERTVVNAAFGNYVSAARGLVDRMQAVMRDYDRGSVKELYKNYWKLPSTWYDRGGLYVFMYEIRNPVQHGQTVVSLVRENGLIRVRFDLDQIADMRDYNTSPKLRAFLNKSISIMKERDSSGCPYLCFRYTNMKYQELYLNYSAIFWIVLSLEYVPLAEI